MKQQRFCIGTILFFILHFGYADSARAQQSINGFSLKNIDLKEFPTVKGELWVRDWNGINTSAVEFFEEQSVNAIKPNLSKPKEATDSLAKNKCIVFLVLNPGRNRLDELTWYKTVLKNAIQNGNVKKGDKITVLNYNNQVDGQLLFPSGVTFTDDINVLKKMIDDILPRESFSICQPKANLLDQSINQTLELLEKKFLQMPKGIIALHDDRKCVSTTDPKIKANQMDVSIYSIVYNNGEQNSSKDLCKSTYGIFFSDPLRDTNNSTNKLNDYLKKFLQRQAGLNYTFNYESKYEKDGKTHLITMNYNGAQKTMSPMDLPSKNILEWIVANPIGAAIIFVVIVLVTVLIFLLVSKNKKQRQMEKMMEQQRLMEVDRKHKENEDMLAAKLTSQQQELEAIKRKEAAQREQELRKKTQEEEMKKEAALIAQMKLNGNFAWFDYTTGDGQRHRFEIRQPVVVVGRDAGCQLSIDLPTVSKKHLQLNYTANNEYWVKDLGSSNGLYINGQRVQQSKLKHGDFIQAGELVLNFFI